MAGRATDEGPAGQPMSTATDKRSDDRRAATLPDAAVPGPRLVFFDVPSRRDLAQRAAAAAPGVRFASRHSWTEDPGEPRRSLLGGDAPIGLWHWKGTAEEFAAEAGDVLLRFVHPLVAREAPFCLGFSFGAEALEPRSLGIGEVAALDLEDIGRLLRPVASPDSAPVAPPSSASARLAIRPLPRHPRPPEPPLPADPRAARMPRVSTTPSARPSSTPSDRRASWPRPARARPRRW